MWLSDSSARRNASPLPLSLPSPPLPSPPLPSLQSDSFARDEFLVQCKLEARRLAASQERPRTASSRDEADVDDDMSDALLD